MSGASLKLVVSAGTTTCEGSQSFEMTSFESVKFVPFKVGDSIPGAFVAYSGTSLRQLLRRRICRLILRTHCAVARLC